MTEACAVDTLHARQVGSSVAGDRDVLVNRQYAGHARSPERLFANLTQDVLVQLSKLRHAGFDGTVRASDQFDLRLAEVGCDVRMAQRRAQCCRVRCHHQCAAWIDPQAFLLDAAANALQRALAQATKAFVDVSAARGHLNAGELGGMAWGMTSYSARLGRLGTCAATKRKGPTEAEP